MLSPQLLHGASCRVTDKSGRTPLDLIPSNVQEGSSGGEEGEVVREMVAVLKRGVEEEKEKQREMEREIERDQERGREDDKENAMEIEPSATSQEPRKSKVILIL